MTSTKVKPRKGSIEASMQIQNLPSRPLGQVRVSLRPDPVKLPPVDNFPSRSFEDTFVRGLQVGKPAVVNISTQVYERQLLNPTPEPRLARPSREELLPDIDIEHKAVDTRNIMSSDGSESEVQIINKKEQQAEQIVELKGQMEQLLDEVADLMESERVQREKAKELQEMWQRERIQSSKKDTIISSLEEKLESAESELKDKTQKLEESTIRLNELERFQDDIAQLERENFDMKNKIDLMEKGRQDDLDRMNKEKEAALAKLRREMEEEMFLKEERIDTLRKTLEAMMSQKSQERQKQLDELTKNFAKVQDECDILRMKMKNYQNKSKTSCENCGRLSFKLEEKISSLQQKEKQVLQCQQQNNHLRSQLVQQDNEMGQIIKERAIETITVYK